MKQYEELTRLRVEEAIQTGLRSQAAQRARSEHKHPAPPVSVEMARQFDPRPSAESHWFTLLFYWILGFGG